MHSLAKPVWVAAARAAQPQTHTHTRAHAAHTRTHRVHATRTAAHAPRSARPRSARPGPTSSVAVHAPLATSHTHRVVSALPLASWRPSGLQATEVTVFQCH